MQDNTEVFQADGLEIAFPGDENVTYAFFGKGLSEEGYDRYWTVSRPLEPRRDATEPVTIERDDQGCTTRGGVVECILARHQLSLVLDSDAACDLQSVPRVLIEFAAPDEDFVLLRQAFDAMFRDHHRYRVVGEVEGVEGDSEVEGDRRC